MTTFNNIRVGDFVSLNFRQVFPLSGGGNNPTILTPARWIVSSILKLGGRYFAMLYPAISEWGAGFSMVPLDEVY